MLGVSVLLPNNYKWPTNASKTITTVFGEVRPRRYHAGIDVRTYGKNGFELYAVENGYIEKIKTSSKGYGKAVYIRLDDGNIAVYAHLEKFTPHINQVVKYLHKYYNSYTIEHEFEPNEFSVNKGDVIGYSGDTGSIGGPHLHFEIRDPQNNPINPMTLGLNITDTKYPIAKKLIVIPKSTTALIDGFPQRKIYPITKLSQSEYVISDTISILGEFGLSAQIIDKVNQQPFNFGIYGINLMIDEQFVYSIQFDKYRFDENPLVFTERDYRDYRETFDKTYQLFTNHQNNNLSFIEKESLPSYKIENGYHTFTIEAWDYSQNMIFISGVIVAEPVIDVNFALNTLANKQILTFDRNLKLNLDLKLRTSPNDNLYKEINIISNKNGQIEFSGNNQFYNVLQITGTNISGIPIKPTYMKISSKATLPIITHKLIHDDNGIYIQFSEQTFTGKDAKLIIYNNETSNYYPISRTNKNELTSSLFSIDIFKDFTSAELFYDNAPDRAYRIQFLGDITKPNELFHVFSNDSLFSVSGNYNSFYEQTYVWIKSIEAPSPTEGEIIEGPYFFGPNLVPYKNEVNITFNITGEEKNMSNYNICYYDMKKEKWYPMVTTENNGILSTTALSGEIFAVISENNAPYISHLTPRPNGTYLQKDIKSISFSINDTFAGLDGESDIIVILDGNRIIHEYNSYRKKVYFEIEDLLSLGQHSIKITAIDKMGNTKIINGTFRIK